MKLIVAIPVFNERKYVEHVLNKVRQYDVPILFIDDGSTDGTVEFLQSHREIQLLAHETNRGYGQTIIDAFAWADQHAYDWVITMDCDEQHEPAMIPTFIKAIEEDRSDVISGSRYLSNDATDDAPPTDRRAINAAMTSMINDTLGLGITDAFCGFKAHRVCATTPLNLSESGYAFPMQFWPRAAAAKLRISELPVRLIYNDLSRQFGGALNDATARLKHYTEVFQRELAWQPAADVASCCCSK